MSSSWYGNHPYGTRSKRDIARRKRASSGQWRDRDGMRHPVRVRRVA